MNYIAYTAEEFRAIVDEEYEEHGVPSRGQVYSQINGWRVRGDGAAVYRNLDLGHRELGAIKIVSYGSNWSQLETSLAHVKPADALSGKDVERHEQAYERWLAAGIKVGPVPTGDDLTHTIGEVCVACSHPPQRLPDGLPAGAINWRYQLEGIYRGAEL